MQPRRRAEMNYRKQSNEHRAKAAECLKAFDAARIAGDAALAQESLLQALAHNQMAQMDLISAKHAHEARPLKVEDLDPADYDTSDLILELFPSGDPDIVLEEVLKRVLILEWTRKRVCVRCGELHDPPPGIEKAVELARAGQLDAAVALRKALHEKQHSTQH
jgi:hypothetical protein